MVRMRPNLIKLLLRAGFRGYHTAPQPPVGRAGELDGYVGKVNQRLNKTPIATEGKEKGMAKKARKRRSRRKNKANHGKRPNAGRR